ncbi:MAG: hemerythrin domain-containing protein [bacterium]
MDKLTKEAQYHGEIFESLTFFQKSLAALAGEKSESCLKDLNIFFDEHIVEHFQFEEKEIFDIIIKSATPEEKHLIRSLQEEHIQLLDRIDRFKDLFAQCEVKPEKNKLEARVTLSKDIVETMLAHARKEDTELFPLLRKYHLDIE